MISSVSSEYEQSPSQSGVYGLLSASTGKHFSAPVSPAFQLHLAFSMQVEEEDTKPPRSMNSDSEVALDLVDKEFDELDDFEDEEANDDVFRIRDKIERPEAKTHTTRELHGMSLYNHLMQSYSMKG